MLLQSEKCGTERVKGGKRRTFSMADPRPGQNVFVHCDPFDPKSRSNSRQLLHPCQMHPQCKFGDRRSVACRDNADISIFYDVLKTQ